MVITVFPTNSGTAADHAVVPAAVPASPFEVDHLTAVTPTLSLAVPLIPSHAKDVETMLAPGEIMVREGGVVSVDGGVAGGCAGGADGGVGSGGLLGCGVGGCAPAAP